MGGLNPAPIPAFSGVPPTGIAPAAWDDAYRRAEAYLNALGVARRFQLHNEVRRILGNVAHGHAHGGMKPADAVLEIECEVTSWFSEVLGNGENPPKDTSTRGKLALLRCGAFDLWPDAVLSRPPQPDEFVAAMRGSPLSSMPPVCDGRVLGPDLDLGKFPRLVENTLWRLDRTRRIRALLALALAAALLALLLHFAR